MCNDILVVCPEHGRPEQAFMIPITPSMHLREDAASRRVILSSNYGWRVGEWIFQVQGQILEWMSHFLDSQRFVATREDVMTIYHSHSLVQVKQALREMKLKHESERLGLFHSPSSSSSMRPFSSLVTELDISPTIPMMKALYSQPLTRHVSPGHSHAWQRATEPPATASLRSYRPRQKRISRSIPLLGARAHSGDVCSPDYFCQSEGQIPSVGNLRKLLQQPVLVELLRNMMTHQHCQENLAFIEAIDRYRILRKGQLLPAAEKVCCVR